jgi:hypothetical protein
MVGNVSGNLSSNVSERNRNDVSNRRQDPFPEEAE